MSTPVWITPPGSLGTIPEGVFYAIPLAATADVPVYYKLIAGRLPLGMFIDETGILSGNPAAKSYSEGIPLPVAGDTISQFAVRAYTETNQLADRTFTITVTGQNTVTWVTPAGSIGTYYDGNQITDLQLQYLDADIYAKPVVTLINGSLPPGLTLSTSGVISGYIKPAIAIDATPGYSYAGTQGYSQFPYDFTTISTTTNYEFTVRVTNGQSSDTRTFDILVYALDTMTADNSQLTADNTFVTADVTPQVPPIITTPTGSIGSVRSDNFFAFQFTGIDFNYNAFQFIATTSLPPGLTLDPNSGWLYGYIPASGILNTVYSFSLIAQETTNTSVVSGSYTFNLTITGPVGSDVTWLTPNNLGSIFNGSTSTFYVAAVNSSGLTLTYQLLSGSNSRLPQGLQLLPSGNIAGRVSFDTFAVDNGSTTFDATTNSNTTVLPKVTTFDMVCTFTVLVTSTNGVIYATNTFSITVIREYQMPYNNLYIQAMPPEQDRYLLNNLLQNTSIFPPALIYRNDDPNFGVATRVIYEHAYGLTAATQEEYLSSLVLNHYWKNLTLGEIKTAQAVDPVTGKIVYEVVYSEVVDNLVNNKDQSADKSVNLPFTIENDIATVYPNALVDMRTQVIDVVGQESNLLPLWMLSKQANGQVLGFTPAWIIAYTNPGQSGQVAYNITTQFGNQLNLVDFEVDRYELDCLLTKNWNPYTVAIPLTTILGDGEIITATFAEQNSAPYVVGQEIVVAGVTPATYNKNYYVRSCTTTQVTFVGYATALATGGTVSNMAGWMPTPPSLTTFDLSKATATWINTSNAVVSWINTDGNQVSWTYGTPPGTIFDGGSMQFIAPVDMYSANATTVYDKYLMFPYRTIIEPIPQVNQVLWVNDYNDLIVWVNNSNKQLIWTSVTAA